VQKAALKSLASAGAEMEPEAPPAPPAPSGNDTTTAPSVSTKAGAAVGYRQLQNAKVQVLNGKFAGREVELKKALTTLGNPGVQVIAITKRSEGYYIVLVENKRPDSPPAINGAALGSQAVKLEDNDVVEIIGIKMGFFAS
jgi:hypothetical protein